MPISMKTKMQLFVASLWLQVLEAWAYQIHSSMTRDSTYNHFQVEQQRFAKRFSFRHI